MFVLINSNNYFISDILLVMYSSILMSISLNVTNIYERLYFYIFIYCPFEWSLLGISPNSLSTLTFKTSNREFTFGVTKQKFTPAYRAVVAEWVNVSISH